VEAMEKLGLLRWPPQIQSGVVQGADSGTVRVLVRPGSAATLRMGEPPFRFLSGRWLLGEGRLYARFTEGKLPSGESIPVCFELYDLNERKAGRVPEGNSGPDTARTHAGISVRAVRRFE